MPSSNKIKLRELTQMSILLAGAIALRLLESSLSYLMPLPGAHLGLANCITIIVLYLYGPYKTLLFLVARVLLVGLLFTGILTPGFLIGLGGASLSYCVMAKASSSALLSPVGVGLLGAFFHNVGQILVAIVLMHTAALFSYLPVLILLGIPTGFFTGFLAKLFLDRLKTYWQNK